MSARDLHVLQGIPLRERYTWTAGGVRQNFTGWRAVSQARKANGDLLMDLTPYLAVVPAEDGGEALQLDVPGDVTRTVDAPGQWDLRLVNADGGEAVDAVPLLHGQVTFTPAVTVTT